MYQFLFFCLASAGILVISRRALRHPGAHGFYRTFAWEAILALFLLNVEFWLVDPFSWHQVISWVLLTGSLALILTGAVQLRRFGRLDRARSGEGLIGIEKTTRLVTTGIYRHLRHPFYASLLSLAWGLFAKHPSWAGLGLAGAASALLVVTALIEEQENLRYFGEPYREYMRRSRRFLPFLF